MVNVYLVQRKNEFYGILANKEEKNLFKMQRKDSIGNYEIVKVKESEVYKKLETHHYNVNNYMSVNIEGFILFPHEEIGLIEYMEMEFQSTVDDINLIYSFIGRYIKMDDEEKRLFSLCSVVLMTAFKNEFMNGVYLSENKKTEINQKAMIATWIRMIDDDQFEDSYL